MKRQAKQKFYQAALGRVERMWLKIPAEQRGPLGHYCPFWAGATVSVLREQGLNAVLQAGSAFWPLVRQEQDDGKINTHYGYQWDDKSVNIARVIEGYLPEIHAWAGIIETQEIVDMTTWAWPERARQHGQEFTGDRPPDFFWGSELPTGVVYEPSRSATQFMHSLLVSHANGGPIVFQMDRRQANGEG